MQGKGGEKGIGILVIHFPPSVGNCPGSSMEGAEVGLTAAPPKSLRYVPRSPWPLPWPRPPRL